MKSFITNNLKVVVAIIITTIIVGSLSVYAASQYFAKDISFTPTNENFRKENGEPIDNVEDALNELFTKSSDLRVAERNNDNFVIPKGIKKAWVLYTSGTSGNSEYKISIDGTIINDKEIIVNKTGYGNVLWTELKVYKIDLSGESGYINCSVGGVTGSNYGYQISVLYK